MEAGLSIITTYVIMNESSITLLYNNICASWSGPYQMTLRGSFTVKINQDNYRYFINSGTFTIPGEFRY